MSDDTPIEKPAVEEKALTRKQLVEMIKARRKMHGARIRMPQKQTKVLDQFVDSKGVEYARLTNGQLLRITPKK